MPGSKPLAVTLHVCVGSLWLLASCGAPQGRNGSQGDLPQDEERADLEAVSAAGGGRVSAPFDVAAIIHQVHFAYRPEGEGFSSEHGTYSVSVTQGQVRLTPYHPQAGSAR